MKYYQAFGDSLTAGQRMNTVKLTKLINAIPICPKIYNPNAMYACITIENSVKLAEAYQTELHFISEIPKSDKYLGKWTLLTDNTEQIWIRTKNITRKNMFDTLCHELAHSVQYKVFGARSMKRRKTLEKEADALIPYIKETLGFRGKENGNKK